VGAKKVRDEEELTGSSTAGATIGVTDAKIKAMRSRKILEVWFARKL
jgi:hypothetical protein